MQIYKLDFNITFYQTKRRKSLQIFLAILCILSLIVDQVDIIETYFKSLLIDNKVPIFMKLLLIIESFKFIKLELVACLVQSIYGLK